MLFSKKFMGKASLYRNSLNGNLTSPTENREVRTTS
jgi:hypothetical protein